MWFDRMPNRNTLMVQQHGWFLLAVTKLEGPDKVSCISEYRNHCHWENLVRFHFCDFVKHNAFSTKKFRKRGIVGRFLQMFRGADLSPHVMRHRLVLEPHAAGPIEEAVVPVLSQHRSVAELEFQAHRIWANFSCGTKMFCHNQSCQKNEQYFQARRGFQVEISPQVFSLTYIGKVRTFVCTIISRHGRYLIFPCPRNIFRNLLPHLLKILQNESAPVHESVARLLHRPVPDSFLLHFWKLVFRIKFIGSHDQKRISHL